MSPIIEVKHLTKEYSLGAVTSIKDTLRYGLARLTGKQTWKRERFKALNDVSFSIEEGEVVGIIGHNGAGKSTLLKHLAHITNPTCGEVAILGSVAPLIEVGAGVNPELTGRENIYLNAAILGIPKKIIRQKLNEIIVFSELEQFIDTPVKRYSSGMKVKLGFSIATNMDADILIIDEVLAVGDLAFQRKCFDRMESMIKGQGKTVLLVSHNIRQVERLCTRVILIENGRFLADGDPSEVCTLFYDRSNKKIQQQHQAELARTARITNTDEITLLSIDLVNAEMRTIQEVPSRSTLRIRVRFSLRRRLVQPEIIIGTHTTDFFYLTAGSTGVFANRPDLEPGEHTIIYEVENFPLASGTYCIRFSVFGEHRRPIFIGEALKTFFVTEPAGNAHESGWWSLNLPTNWRIDDHCFEAHDFSSG